MFLEKGVEQNRYYRFMQIKNEYKTKPLHEIHLRVVMYGRVSTNKIEQKTSIMNQEQFYSSYITNNPNWEYVGEYIDEGITGTSAKKRENFQKMIDDAIDGKFDMIITKEISRFARNTLDSIYYTRKLLENHVAVFFQNDNINTLDEDSELRLTIMSGIAQEEITKLSKRIKFGHKQSIKNGTVFGNSMIYGYTKHNGKLIIDEKEAEMIKHIFSQYATGTTSTKKLENELYDMGYRNHKGGKINSAVIKHIIVNPKYKGYYCGNKVEIIDIFSKKQFFKPEEEWTQWKDETGETVPAIVDEELWNEANKIYTLRSQNIKSRRHSYKTKNMFTGKIYCAEHNKPFWMKQRGTRSQDNNPRWECSYRMQNGKDSCKTINITESVLFSLIQEIINMISYKKDDIIETYIKYLHKTIDNSDVQKEIKVLEEKINILENKKEKILEYSLDEIITKEEFKKRNNLYNEEIQSNKSQLINLQNNSIDNISSDIEQLKEILNKYSDVNIEDIHRKELVDELFDKIYVKALPNDNEEYTNQMEIIFCLNSGENIKGIIKKTSPNGGCFGNMFFKVLPEQTKIIKSINITALRHEDVRLYKYYVSM